MINNEAEAEALLVDTITRVYPLAHFFKAEDPYRPGVWDLSYCIQGKEGWIELKYTKNKSNIKLRPKQYRWGRAATDAGRRTFLVLCDESEAPGDFLFIPGDYIRHKKITTWLEWISACQRSAGFSVPIMSFEANIQRVVSLLRGEV